MREEIKNMWEQAKADFKTAQNSFNSKDYYASVFWCQQSIEKALKSKIMFKEKENYKIHSLIRLGRIAKIPKRYLLVLKNLSPDYYLTRYSDASNESPYKLYNEGD